MSIDRALGVAGVAAALPGLVQIAIELTGKVSELYKDFRDSTKQIDLQQSVLLIQLIQIEADLYFVKTRSQDFTVPIQESLVDIIRELVKSYRDVSEVFSFARGPDLKVRPGAWALKVKSGVEALVQDIEIWQRRFMELIQLLHFTGFGFRDVAPLSVDTISRDLPASRAQILGANLTKAMDNVKSKSNKLLLQSLPVPDDQLCDVPLSRLRAPEANAPRNDFVVEYRRYTRTDDIEYLNSIVQYSAEILAAADPCTMHVLCCEGYVHRPNLRQFQTILKFPPGLGSPRTLRDLLLDPDPQIEPSITSRIQLCKKIATAALYTHTASLVHKAIQPEAILILKKIDSVGSLQGEGSNSLKTTPLGIPFLTGFGQARQETPDTYSSLRENTDWEQDLYSHPSRQGRPTTKYTMAHDIYSIGVILLEIGLWRSFVVWNGFNDFTIDEGVLSGGKAIFKRMKERKPKAGEELKKLYENLAAQELPNVMGERFCEVVLRCLGAVEGGLAEAVPKRGRVGADVTITANERQEEEIVGLGYIQSVLESLDNIKV
ncbi:hypothetical protein OIDMADRAFT_127885 [Oidiodendron maius Zn]|uniref:Protein kinase domain-containing protein n=1 Tax=Oidiodendron maius (strain Zn) TaxID=913774 RepID=A0A0C3H7L2_OIDMZ|nr:hypothetical protein OIDMADRAFT_127885 [Oidiodendron maius Zn]